MKYGWPLAWSHGHGFVERGGGMLGPVHFRVADGREVQPFAVFPWADEVPPPQESPLTGLMKRGRGEWPCVPFGYGPQADSDGWNPPIHGEPSHMEWRRIDDGASPARIRLRYDCAPEGPIEALERDITGVDGMAAIDCRLMVFARRSCDLPVGLHPTLRLPDRPSALKLEADASSYGLTYPQEVEPGADIVAPASLFSTLGEVRRHDGGLVDLRRLPLTENTESIVQLCGIDGCVAVHNEEERYRFEIRWDSRQLPSCLLWISNRGRSAWPWSGRHLALGVEPVCSHFDLGIAQSRAPNAVSARGVATSLKLSPDEPLVLDYRLVVSEG
jgi:hypothetical protein